MVPSPALRMAAALLVLGFAVATVPAAPMPSVMEARAGWKARSHRSASIASTASADPKEQSYAANGYEEGYYEEKEICLQEVTRRDCSVCPGPPATGNCAATHAQFTSDVACCQHKEGYGGGYGHGSASVGDHLWGPHSSIGSCDWMGHIVPGVEVTTNGNINKWGQASAICYFGADSQDCGGPFCDRMVVTLEGAIYWVDRVYSYYTETTTDTPECAALTGGIGNRRMSDQKAAAQDPAQAKQPAKQPAKPAAHTAADASVQYNYNHYEEPHHTTTVYGGGAVVINGAVTAMIGPKKEKWENGLFEYVFQFVQGTTNGGVVTTIDASIPWVRDKTYKFTFYKSQGYY